MIKEKGFCITVVILMFLFILLADVNTSLAQEGPLRGPMKKFSRGFLNVFFGWLELGETACEVGREEGVPAGATYGVLKGSLFCLIRSAVGVYEVATFAIPIPWDYEPIFKDPEFYPGKGEGGEGLQ